MKGLKRLVDLDINSLMELGCKVGLFIQNKKYVIKFLSAFGIKNSTFLNNRFDRYTFIDTIIENVAKDVELVERSIDYTNSLSRRFSDYKVYKSKGNYFEFCEFATMTGKIYCDVEEDLKMSYHEPFEDSIIAAVGNNDFYNEDDDIDTIISKIPDEDLKSSFEMELDSIIDDMFRDRVNAYAICSERIDKYVDDNYTIEDDIINVDNDVMLTTSLMLYYIDNIKDFINDSDYQRYHYSYIRSSYNPLYKYEFVFVYIDELNFSVSRDENKDFKKEIYDIMKGFEVSANFISNVLI